MGTTGPCPAVSGLPDSKKTQYVPSATSSPIAQRNVSEDFIITALFYSFFLVFHCFSPVLMHLSPHVLTTCTSSSQKSASETIQNVVHMSIFHSLQIPGNVTTYHTSPHSCNAFISAVFGLQSTLTSSPGMGTACLSSQQHTKRQ